MPDDAFAAADARVRSWQVGYSGIMSESYLGSLRPEISSGRFNFAEMNPERGPYTLVAVEHGSVCGYVTVGESRDEDQDEGAEIWSLCVAPEHWGTGVGGALLTAACEHLREADYEWAFAWVLGENTRARRFYEQALWTVEGKRRTEFIGGGVIQQLRYLTFLW